MGLHGRKGIAQNYFFSHSTDRNLHCIIDQISMMLIKYSNIIKKKQSLIYDGCKSGWLKNVTSPMWPTQFYNLFFLVMIVEWMQSWASELQEWVVSSLGRSVVTSNGLLATGRKSRTICKISFNFLLKMCMKVKLRKSILILILLGSIVKLHGPHMSFK